MGQRHRSDAGPTSPSRRSSRRRRIGDLGRHPLRLGGEQRRSAAIFDSPKAADVQNLMIETRRRSSPGTKPTDAVKVTKNVDFATYLKAVDATRAVRRTTRRRRRSGFASRSRPPSSGSIPAGSSWSSPTTSSSTSRSPLRWPTLALGGTAAKVYRLQAKVRRVRLRDQARSPTPTARSGVTGNLKEFTPEPGSSRVLVDQR